MERIVPHSNPRSQIHSVMNLDPRKQLSSHELQATLWRVAAVASVVAFIAIGIGAIVALAILNPALLPFAIIGLGSISYPASKTYTHCKQKAMLRDSYAEIERKTVKELDRLDNLSDTSYNLQLYIATPNWDQSEKTKELLSRINSTFDRTYAPVLARFSYWEKVAKEAHDQIETIKEDIQNISSDIQENRSTLSENEVKSKNDSINSLRKRMHEITELDEGPAKVKAAFMLYVLKHPLITDSEKNIEDFGSFDILNYEDRALLKEYESRNPLFSKKDHSEIRKDWILSHNFRDISNAIFS